MVRSMAPIVLEWVLRTRASIYPTWRALSDTDRFNRAVGAEFSFVERPNPDGSTQRTGSFRTLGLNLTWQEAAFDFVAPYSFHVERQFNSGPVDRYHVDLQLTAERGGTRIRYAITAWARSGLLRPIVALQMAATEKRRLDRELNLIVAHLDGEVGDAGPLPPALDPAAQVRLNELTTDLTVQPFAAALRAHIIGAPVADQDRMMPLLLARRWQMDEDLVIDGCLEAVRVGLLSLTWDLLCPSCHGPKARLTTLDLSAQSVHCDSCNVTFDAGFADAVAVSFRPAPSIRELDDRPRCIGSPARTPHMLARANLLPRSEVEWQVDLLPGGHRVRLLTSMTAASIEAVDDATADVCVIDVGLTAAAPARLTVRPGPVRIIVRSTAPSAQWVVLERRSRPEGILTAGNLLGRATARESLPEGVLGPNLGIEVHQSGIYAGEVFGGGDGLQLLQDELRARGARAVVSGSREVVATWPTFEGALDAAAAMQGALRVCGAIGVGVTAQSSSQGGDMIFGRAVEGTLKALVTSLPGSTALWGGVAETPRVRSAVASRSATTVPAPTVEGCSDYLLRFQATAPPAGLARLHIEAKALEGTTIAGKYLVGGKLGEGGFGAVYDVNDGGAVLKVLKLELAQQELTVQQFFVEARTASRLRHPNVVDLFDFGHLDDGRLFVLMERLQGCELAHVIGRRRSIPADAACRIACDILDGLAAAHEAGVLHRDVKPSNVFLHRDDGVVRAMLIDFGIARDLATPDVLDKKIVGTFAYMSPEQLQIAPHDHRADLYSVGLILYRCLAAKVPYFELGTAGMATARIARDAPPIADASIESLPDGLASVVTRALARDPAARFQDARVMKRALERFAGPREPLNELIIVGESADWQFIDTTIDSEPPQGN